MNYYDKENEKQLISIRIKKTTLRKVEDYRHTKNASTLWTTPNRKYYNSSLGGYCSRCDVIEQALKEFFENHKI